MVSCEAVVLSLAELCLGFTWEILLGCPLVEVNDKVPKRSWYAENDSFRAPAGKRVTNLDE